MLTKLLIGKGGYHPRSFYLEEALFIQAQEHLEYDLVDYITNTTFVVIMDAVLFGVEDNIVEQLEINWEYGEE